MLFRFWRAFLFSTILVFGVSGWAGPSTFIYQGQIIKNTGQPLSGSTVFTVQILSPGLERCVLYEEKHTVNMTSTEGVFSLSIGGGARSGTKYENTSNLVNVFKNTNSFTGLDTCLDGSSSSYSPSGLNDRRRLRMTYNDGSGDVVVSVDHNIQAVPYAWDAKTIEGLAPSDFVRTSPVNNLTQANIEALFTGSHYSNLLSLANNTTAAYVKSGSGGAIIPSLTTDPSTPTAGAVWFNTTTGKMMYYDGTVKEIGSGGGGGSLVEADIPTLSTAGKVVGTAIVSGQIGGSTSINTSGNITTTGSVTAATLSSTSASHQTLNIYDSDNTNFVRLQAPATGSLTTNYTLTLPTDNGNVDDVLRTDGNGQLSWVPMTMNIADGSITDAKIDTVGVQKITSALGQYFTYRPNNGACLDGETLKWNTLTGWECGTDNDSGGTGDITAVNTTAPLSGGNTSGAISLTLSYDNSSVGINGSNQLEVKDAGVTTAKIADSSVTTGKMADGAVTDAKIDSVSVDKVTSASGQYFNYMPNGAACTDGQVLKWEDGNSRWACANDTDTNTDAVSTVFGRSGAVTAQAGDYTATQITNTGAGNISATTVQAAITELDTEKVAKSGDTMSGQLTMADSIQMNAQNAIRFGDGDSSNYVALRAPAAVGTNITWTLPATDGSPGEFLSTDGSGVLSWSPAASGDITGVTTGSSSGLSGGAASGTATLQVEVDNSSIEINGSNDLQVKDDGITSAKIADGAVTDAKIDTVGVQKITSALGQYLTYRPNNGACTDGQTLKWNTLTGWECGDDDNSGGTGDITAVNTTAPLSGGNTSGAVSLVLNYDNTSVGINGSNQLEVKDGGITSAKIANANITTVKIADSNVTTAKIADGAVTDAKIDSVSVDKVTSASGQYFNYMPNGAACTDGQVLKWDDGNSRWACANDTDTNTDAVSTVFGRSGAVTAQAGDYTATQITNAPAGNIAATTAQAAITELDNEKVAKAGDTMTGNLTINAQNAIRFGDGDSSNYVALRAPAAVGTNITWTLPATDGSPGEFLSTDGSGTLSWSAAASGDITGVTTGTSSGLSGGAASGTATLQVEVDNTTVEINGSNDLQVKDAGITTAKIADANVTTAKIADSNVTTAKIANGAVTDAKIDTVGVQKITSALGQYLTYYPNGGACADGQTLKWNTLTGWECGNDNNTAATTPGGATTQIQFNNSGSFAGSSNFVWDNTNSRLGIGTAPSFPLHLERDLGVGAGENQLAVFRRSSSGTGFVMGYQADGTTVNYGYMRSSNGADLGLGTAANNKAIYISSANSNVGIGTTSPNALLTVEGVTSLRETSAPSSTANYGKIYVKSSDSKLYFMNDSGDEVDLSAAGTGAASAITNTPAGNIAATTVQAAITELDNEKVAKAGDAMTGNLTMNAQNAVRYADSDSSNYVAIRAPAAVGSNVTLTLPATAGSSGDVLSTDGAGVLSWVAAATGDITAVNTTAPLSGGNTSGAISLTLAYDDSSIGINGSNQLEVKNAGITDAKIDTVGVQKITSALGQYLTYYPNGGACGDGQTLKWNTLTGWECGDDNNTAATTPGGATTQVQYNNGGSFAGSSNFVWDNTNGRLGLATSSPYDRLHVENGDIRVSGSNYNGVKTFVQSDTTSAYNLYYRSRAAGAPEVKAGDYLGSWGFRGHTGSAYFTQDSARISGMAAEDGSTGNGGYLAFFTSPTGSITGGQERLRINSTGQVGVGTTSTNALLTVEGVTSLRETSAPSATANYGKIYVKSSDSKLYFMNDSGDEVDLSAAGTGTASAITNTPAGNIAATTVQAAITELDNEKVAKAGDAMTGNLTMNAQNAVRFGDSDSSNYVAIRAPAAVGSNVTLTLPATAGSSGDVLSTDGAGVLSWVAAATGDITAVNTTAPLSGGNTSGAISLTLAYDDSSIGINGSNQLEVKDTGISTAKLANSAVTDAKIDTIGVQKITSALGQYLTYRPNNGACSDGQTLKWNTLTGWECGDDNNTAATTPGGATTQVQYNNSGAFAGSANFVWDNTNSRLGIGTASPSKNLEVSAADTSTELRVVNRSSTATRGPKVSVRNYTGGNGGYPYISMFNSRGSEASTAAIQSGDRLGSFEYVGGYNTSGGYSTAADVIGEAEGNFSSTSTPGRLIFRTTASSSTSPTERMRIDSSGNVGIGTTSPAAQFEVALGSNGSVKTGLASPVHGTMIDVTYGTAWARELSFAHSGSKIGSVGMSASGATPGFLYFSANQGGATAGNSTANMVIDSTGNVGIGTTSPRGQGMHVHTTSTWTGIKFTTAATGSAESDGGRFGYDDTNGLMIWNREAAPVAFATSDQKRMIIDSSGNVAIGSSDPASGKRLEIQGPHQGTEMRLFSTGDGSGNTGILNLWASEPGVTYTGVGIGNNIRNYNGSTSFVRESTSRGGSYIRLLDNAMYAAVVNSSGTTTSAFQVDGSGNMGIGMSPSNKLHVSGSIGATGWIGAGCEGACSTDAYVINYADGRIHTYDGSSAVCTKSGGSATFSCSSDRKFKNTILDFEDGLDFVSRLRPRTYYWNDDKNQVLQYGFIAQEVQEVIPEAVSEQEKEGEPYLSLDQGKFTPYIINSIKQLYKKILVLFDHNKQINRKISSLNSENSALKDKIKALSKKQQELEKKNKMMESYLCAKDPSAPICH